MNQQTGAYNQLEFNTNMIETFRHRGQAKRLPRLRGKFSMNNKPVEFYVDTGADITRRLVKESRQLLTRIRR